MVLGQIWPSVLLQEAIDNRLGPGDSTGDTSLSIRVRDVVIMCAGKLEMLRSCPACQAIECLRIFDAPSRRSTLPHSEAS